MFPQEQYNQILNMLNKTSVTDVSAHMAGISLTLHGPSSIPKWIVDSGATNHMLVMCTYYWMVLK